MAVILEARAESRRAGCGPSDVDEAAEKQKAGWRHPAFRGKFDGCGGRI